MSTPYPTLQYGHSEEIGLLRETVHQFASTEIAPRAADIDRDNDFPRDLWTKMGDLGLLGITIPCLLYTSPSPRDAHESRMPSSA